MMDAILEWIEPTAGQTRKALHAAATAQLNHAPDASQLLSEYAELAGKTMEEARVQVSEYLDDRLI
jgi:hypothetical protein